MTSNIFKGLAISSLFLLVWGCGGNEPATPEQKKELTDVVQTATAHLKESKKYTSLPGAELPPFAESKGDFYATSEKELHLVGEGVIATIKGNSAEVLFTISVKKDSAARENRDALVRLVREGGKWRGDGAYVDKGEEGRK